MQDALGIVVFVVVALAALIAVAGLAARNRAYDEIGRGGLSIDRPPPEPPVAHLRDAEIRQMVQAANARRVRRGEAPRDVDNEIARLRPPVVDPALEAEVRALVLARNARRARRGQPPLEVEAEVRRQLDALSEPAASTPNAGTGTIAPMADPRVFELEDLVNRPGTYFNPQTEVLLIVDDSPEMDQEIFNMERYEGAEWVLVSEEVPVEENQRDELIERFQVRYHPGSEHALNASEDEEDDTEVDELEPDEQDVGRDDL